MDIWPKLTLAAATGQRRLYTTTKPSSWPTNYNSRTSRRNCSPSSGPWSSRRREERALLLPFVPIVSGSHGTPGVLPPEPVKAGPSGAGAGRVGRRAFAGVHLQQRSGIQRYLITPISYRWRGLDIPPV